MRTEAEVRELLWRTGNTAGSVALLVNWNVVPAGADAIGTVRCEVYPLGAGSGVDMAGPLVAIESATLVAIEFGMGGAVGEAVTPGAIVGGIFAGGLELLPLHAAAAKTATPTKRQRNTSDCMNRGTAMAHPPRE